MAATAPTNDICHIAADTVTLSVTNYTNKEVPNSTVLSQGYSYKQVLPLENFNYTMDNHALWMEYFNARIAELQAQIEKERIPVGGLLEISGDSTNPNTLMGYGTWSTFGAGRSTIGVGLLEDNNDYSITWADGDTAGTYQHTLTTTELPAHNHTYSGSTSTNGAHTHSVTMYTSADGDPDGGNRRICTDDAEVSGPFTATYLTIDSAGDHIHTYEGITTSVGDSTAFSLLSPVIAVYRWKRTA